MSSPSFKEEILHQVDRLKPEQQREVLDFARTLASANLRGIKGKELLHFAGMIKSEDLQAMAEAIEQDCEKVNVDEW